MAQEKVEQVIAAAFQVFMKYGYRRVTMADLAEAAQMSRPALYLIFPSKEQIFIEVISRALAANLDEIRRGIQPLKTVEEKLALVCELRFVCPFELIRASPDAADIYESMHEFAADLMARAEADFENLLAEILEPLVRKQKALKLSSHQIARILRISAIGFKKAAKDSADLRELMSDMRRIVLSSLSSRAV